MDTPKNETNENDDMEKQLAELERLGKEIEESMKELDKLTEADAEGALKEAEASDEDLESQVEELNRLEEQIDEDIKKLDALDSENDNTETTDSENTEQLSAAEAREMLKKLSELRRVFGEMGSFMDKLGSLCEKIDKGVLDDTPTPSEQGKDE